jgi:Holliday junction resolvase
VSYRRGGGGKRRDANEPDIIDALRSHGCYVRQVGGAGLPDLIVYRPQTDRWFVGEVKTRTGELSKTQEAEAAPWPVWRSVRDALGCVGIL